MSAPLPDRIDPWRAVQAGSSFSGILPIDCLPRLAEAVVAAAGPASYELAFGRDSHGRAVALGRISIAVISTCQRCLDAVAMTLDVPIALALVRAVSEADALGLSAVVGIPDDLDPLPLGEGSIRPLELLEDELLLALPQVPLHPQGACRASTPEDSGGAPSERRESPFGVLATLRDRTRGDGADHD